VFEDVVGTIRARQRASVEARVSGRIDSLSVVPGQSVRKGETLAKLSVREIQARLDQARATLEQSDRDFQRFSALLQQKTITQQEFDAVEARKRVASGAVAEAETLLDYATVTAPFDGIITRKWSDAGDLAGPGRAIVEIEDPSSLRIETDVPEGLIERVTLGARLTATGGSSAHTIEATVGEVSPIADASSRTFRVKLDLPSGSGLRLGQFARVAIPVGENKALRVPRAAVVQRGQMEIVFVVDGDKARLRLVKTGKHLGDSCELVSGLAAGEKVVVQGAAGLVDGQPLKVHALPNP
jgi:RND family efflux transporter MFP subunit